MAFFLTFTLGGCGGEESHTIGGSGDDGGGGEIPFADSSGTKRGDRTGTDKFNGILIDQTVVTRCAENPLITADSSPTIGDNINGPSVIRAPDWLPQRLGRYYMYFAHHKGTFIRLAYSDKLCGKWKVYEPGTLRLEQAKDFVDHIASPDVHVDESKRQIRMYFHGPRSDGIRGQRTGVAVSGDGIHFEVVGSNLGMAYFRVFWWRDAFYAVARGNKSGALLRSIHSMNIFAKGPDIIPRMRHAAILPWDDAFLVFFSRIGDAPERILVSSMSIGQDWHKVIISPPAKVLKPSTIYEGNDLPVVPSKSGPTKRARQLRDPAVFQDEGRIYLFYSIAGESGIALSELNIAR